MRFLKLLSKELREAAPFLILTALLVWAIGSGLLYGASPDSSYRGHWGGRPGETLHRGDLFVRSSLGDFGPLILLAAAALGLLLAGRQFLLPSLLKTWAFTLHRAVSPLLILLAKITAAAIGLCFCVGVIWTYLFLRASQPGVVLFRPRPLVLAEGWLMVALGLVVYFGAALSAISTARWYTTRIFGLAAAAGAVLLTLVQSGITVSVIVALIGLGVLVPQVVHVFLNREY